MTKFSLSLFLRIWLIGLTILGGKLAYAQQNFMVSGEFDGVLFSELVEKIESQTNVHFFYDQETLDSLEVYESFDKTPLVDVLAHIFESTDYNYAIYKAHVFITIAAEIQTFIPESYIESSPRRKNEDIDLFRLDFIKPITEQEEEENIEAITIGQASRVIIGKKAILSGKIKDINTGEPIIGAVILHEKTKTGVNSDVLGNYKISLPTGRTQLKITSMGKLPTTLELMIYEDGKLDVELKEKVTTLKAVVIESERSANVTQTQMGLEKIDIQSLKQLPSLLGEVDVLKAVMTLPGVQSAGESSTGLNVRGGSTGQNLILFNQAPIYNSSHLFGLFSVFNPEVIKEVELYKSGIPAKYGGRLSSVLEVNAKDGNKKQFAGSGGIGLVSGRLAVEGPIIKDKMSFLVSGRSTYSDWLLSRVPNDEFKNSDASFYDFHASTTYDIDNKNSLNISSYFSNDQFSFQDDTIYQYNNFNVMGRWKRIFGEQFFGEFTGGVSQYKYNIHYDAIPENAFEANYQINQSIGKADFYFYQNKHNISFGVNADFYRLSPVNIVPFGTNSLIKNDLIEDEQALETAIYIGDQITLNDRLSLYGAFRYSFFHYLGPGNVNQYQPDLPKTENNIIGTKTYGKNDLIKAYHGPEFRASARFLLDEHTSLKLNYQRMRQYIHMLSNTTSISPIDVWKLSDPHILPEIGDQYSLGVYRNWKSNTIETSVEFYYKTMDNFLDYRDGAQLFLNRNVETDILGTSGIAYGAEIMLKKTRGRFNGWLSYTYARSLLKTDAKTGSESINVGKRYPSSYDKPHDLTLVSNYKFSRRFNFSFNFTYSTGRPTTLPLGKYDLGGVERLFFSERNQYRIPDYLRADVAINLEGNHKIKKLAHSSWSLAVYNVTGRNNAYSVFYRTEDGFVKGYQLSIFGRAIPTLTYNFRF